MRGSVCSVIGGQFDVEIDMRKIAIAPHVVLPQSYLLHGTQHQRFVVLDVCRRIDPRLGSDVALGRLRSGR